MNKSPQKHERQFVIQWHVTNKCDNNCKHCYMTLDERNNSDELNTQECFAVIDKLIEFTKPLSLKPRINFTGGNPLLRKNFEEILGYAKGKGVESQILGNPYPLNKRNLEILKNNDVTRYQLSFEGLRETHDSIRGEGNFDASLEAIKTLRDCGIEVIVMTTTTKQNQYELPDLSRLVLNTGADLFDFARLVPIGNGKQLGYLSFKPHEFRGFLDNMYKHYHELVDEGVNPRRLGTKEPLWSLLLYEKKELTTPDDGLIYTGCSIAKNGFCMNSDGTLYGCRRLPVGIGNIKEVSIKEFFINSKEMNMYRDFENIEGCSDCKVLSLCRGCRAIAWAATGSYFGRDPQCWK